MIMGSKVFTAAGCFILLVLVLPQTTEAFGRFSSPFQDVNGGVNCATCSVIIALIEQTSEYHNESVAKAMERLCSYLPDPQLQQPCKEFIDSTGPLIILLLAQEASPDRACHALGLCRTDPGRQTCHSIPEPPTLMARFDERVQNGQKTVAMHDKTGMFRVGIKICDLPGIKKICQYIENIFNNHYPAVDLDKDHFSTQPTLRGNAWRGKDCDDLDPGKYPGIIPTNDDAVFDSNCNGIFGINPLTNVPYEKELCDGTFPRGIAVLGDSISAHFHLPEEWFDATKLSPVIFQHTVFILENEIDWPHMSTVTGLGFNNWTEVIHGPVDSVYMRQRERNLCNHKDYQNIAVNGARSRNMDSNIMASLARNQDKDRPMVITYALVGNDVCNGHVDDTFANMTTPAEMRANVLKTLDFLDTKLPFNSSVFLVGLADGRVLYDSLKDRIHPIGRFWNAFTYADFYDYFNCLQVSPCSGWMNSNETVRNMTTERAIELSAVLADVAQANKTYYKHYTLYYEDNPFNKAISIWNAKGGQIWQLLEPVDGFHSNQYGQALTTQVVWDEAERLAPEVFGPTNPNNDKIQQLFGDQGPYF